MSVGRPASMASRTGAAGVPERCSPPWMSAHSSSASVSINR
ncbi:Uncharacterised protein [Mycobacteroides abscessus subsp. abscessus]|nr:Uncharacterised protein [Mycobacteroides abscessus subsp. abscessus]